MNTSTFIHTRRDTEFDVSVQQDSKTHVLKLQGQGTDAYIFMQPREFTRLLRTLQEFEREGPQDGGQ